MDQKDEDAVLPYQVLFPIRYMYDLLYRRTRRCMKLAKASQEWSLTSWIKELSKPDQGMSFLAFQEISLHEWRYFAKPNTLLVSVPQNLSTELLNRCIHKSAF